MTKVVSDDDWQEQARTSLRKQRGAWFGTGATAAVSGMFLGLATVIEPGPLRLGAIVIGLALIVISMVWGTLIYMRVIDEQERDANLWGCYVGVVVYLSLYVIKSIGELLKIDLPINETGIFGATMITILAVFAWKRFR